MEKLHKNVSIANSYNNNNK